MITWILTALKLAKEFGGQALLSATVMAPTLSISTSSMSNSSMVPKSVLAQFESSMSICKASVNCSASFDQVKGDTFLKNNSDNLNVKIAETNSSLRSPASVSSEMIVFGEKKEVRISKVEEIDFGGFAVAEIDKEEKSKIVARSFQRSLGSEKSFVKFDDVRTLVEGDYFSSRSSISMSDFNLPNSSSQLSDLFSPVENTLASEVTSKGENSVAEVEGDSSINDTASEAPFEASPTVSVVASSNNPSSSENEISSSESLTSTSFTSTYKDSDMEVVVPELTVEDPAELVVEDPAELVIEDPAGLILSQNSNGNVGLSWTAANLVSGYKISILSGEVAPSDCSLGEDNLALTSKNFTGLTEGGNYSVRVCSYDETAQESEGITLTFSVDYSLPTDASSFQISSIASTSMDLQWDAAGGSTVGYLLSQAAGNVAPVDCSTSTDLGNVTSYTVSGLTAGSEYSFRLCAYNLPDVDSTGVTLSETTAAGPSHGGWTRVFSIGPKVDESGTVLNETGYTASDRACNGTSSCIRLEWGAFTVSSGSIASYNIYRGTASGSLSLVDNVDALSRVFIDTSLTPETTYYYEVKPVLADSSVVTISSPVSEIDVIYPANNMALIHRWAANIDMCATLDRETDESNNYRCVFNGLGNTSGFYDFGLGKADGLGHLLIDRFEASFNTSNKYVNYPNESALVGTSTSDLLFGNYCYNGGTAVSQSVTIDTTLNSKRLLTKFDFMAASKWDKEDSNLSTDALIQNREDGTDTFCSITLNTTAGSDSRSDCVSKYGVQDIVGNYPEIVDGYSHGQGVITNDPQIAGEIQFDGVDSIGTSSGVLLTDASVLYYNPIMGLPLQCAGSNCSSDDKLITPQGSGASILNFETRGAMMWVDAIDNNDSQYQVVGRSKDLTSVGRYVFDWSVLESEVADTSFRCAYRVGD